MGRRTPLYDLHLAAGARMVDFGGWDMPVGYGSQIEEHHAVRRDAGMFDVSHMCVVDLRGAGVRPLLLRLLANDVGRLTAPGKALYSCMLRPDGGVIDDLIACYLDEKWFRVVVNAGTADKDLAWIKEHARQIGVAVVARRDLAIDRGAGSERACEGRCRSCRSPPAPPRARSAISSARHSTTNGSSRAPATPARTGSRSRCPRKRPRTSGMRCAAAGVAPCGLGARDTLRLEAGMNLYGNDMDETVSPLESGLAWTVALEGNARLHRQGRARRSSATRASPASSRDCCSRTAACCARTRKSSRARPARARSRAGHSRRRSSARSRSRACRPRPRGGSRWTSAASACPARIVKPPFVRNGKAASNPRITENRMSQTPADLRYTKSHEWLRTLPDGTIEVGITDHAQQSLGDLVFVEVPEPGRHVAAGDACAVVESVKAASDIYSPVSGEVDGGQSEARHGAGAHQPRSLRRGLDHAREAGGRRRHGNARCGGLRGRGRCRRLNCRFQMPYIPHTPEDVRAMLDRIGAGSIDDLFDEIPPALRIDALPGVPAGTA